MGFCEGDSFGGEQDSVTGICEHGGEHFGLHKRQEMS